MYFVLVLAFLIQHSLVMFGYNEIQRDNFYPLKLLEPSFAQILSVFTIYKLYNMKNSKQLLGDCVFAKTRASHPAKSHRVVGVFDTF